MSMKVLRSEDWRNQQDDAVQNTAKPKTSVALWEGDLKGDTYRLITRAGHSAYQKRVPDEIPGEWKWRDWPRDDVVKLIEAEYTGHQR